MQDLSRVSASAQPHSAQPLCSPPPPPVCIYDTTLRDGAQREGLSLSLEDKLRIARQLDRLGIPFIEGGWPGANPKDVQFFWQLKEEPLSQAQVVAFCSTRRPHRSAAEDPMLQAVLAAGTSWITLFGKSWDLQVTAGLQTSLSENLAMIEDTIAYFCQQDRRVIYDAEHWFDGYKHNPDYALETLAAAVAGGAEWLVLCDTNGGTLPHEISAIVQDVRQFVETQTMAVESHGKTHGKPVAIGIHTHNDAGMADANAIAAVLQGATMVQGTINGYGERCGNANLCTVMPNLQLKLGYRCVPDQQLAQLTESSRFISEVVNLAPDDHAPFVGMSAFAHKAGIHVSAVQRNPQTYEHLAPDRVGNQRRIVISDQAGLSNVLAKARSFGIDLDKQNPACRQILQHLKTLENQGYQFEAAEASFELLMREALGKRQQFFIIKDFNVSCNLRRDLEPWRDQPSADFNSHCTLRSSAAWHHQSLATIKLAANGQDIWEAAEGNGPVSALDAALHKALSKFYPAIESCYLTDYKVRILDSASGAAAKTRVLVESSNGHQRWTTVGVSSNIIEASYQAVVEGLEYGLMLQSQAKAAIECD